MIALSEERTAQEWARELEVKLHGMSDERWDEYVRYLEERDELTGVIKDLLDEAKMLHEAFHLDKTARPQGKEQRRRVWRSLRELRTRRLHDLRARYEAIYDEGEDHD
jgi:Mg2+/Co2+ transporter CorC